MGADPDELKGSGKVGVKPPGSIPKGSSSTKELDRTTGHAVGEPELPRAPDAEFLTAGAILDLRALSLCWALPPSPTISSLSKFNFIHLTPEKWKRKKNYPLLDRWVLYAW